MKENKNEIWMRISRRFDKSVFAPLARELSISSFHLLGAIYRYDKKNKKGYAPLNDIRKMPIVSEIGFTQLSRTLLELENKGLIKREKSDKDKRITNLYLTKEAKVLIERKTKEIDAFWNEVFKKFGNERSEFLIAELESLADIVEEELKKYEGGITNENVVKKYK